MNPYAPPQAQPGAPYPYPHAQPQPPWQGIEGPRLHSPNAVGLATFLGSTLGGALLIADNERRLRRPGAAFAALGLGVVATALLLGIAFAIPSGGTPIPFLSMFLMRQAAAWRLKEPMVPTPGQPVPQFPGRPLSMWLAAGVGVGTLAIVMVVIVAGAAIVTIVHPDKVAFAPADEVYFDDGATEGDARAVGEALKESGFFGESTGKMVTVSKVERGLALSFIVQDGAWSSDETAQTFEKFGHDISNSAFHDPNRIVEVRLCNDWTITKRTLKLQ